MFSHLISSCVTQACPPHIALRATMAKERRRAAAGRAPQILHEYYNRPLHLQSAVCLSGDTVISAYLHSLCVCDWHHSSEVQYKQHSSFPPSE